LDFAIVSELLLRLDPDIGGGAAVPLPPRPSDLLLRLALYSGVGAMLVSLAMLGTIVLLRVNLLRRRRRDRRFLALWRPLMAQCMESVPDAPPALSAAEIGPFLRLWNHYKESLRGTASERLNELAARAGVLPAVRGMLGRRPLRDRLLAVVTLGHLRDRTAWHELRRAVDDASPVLSLAAAHSLLRIEPQAAPGWLVPLAAERADWPLARVAAMLAEAGADRVTPALAAALGQVDARRSPESASRLLRLAETAHPGPLAPAVRRLVREAADEGVVADALGALRDPRDADLARERAAHPSWIVRVSAAKALGRVGTDADRGLLVRLLDDPNWWVRHRAAQSLAGLPSVTPAELRAIRAGLPDGRAAGALDQVIAERE
jgi:HEAT repeat protein